MTHPHWTMWIAMPVFSVATLVVLWKFARFNIDTLEHEDMMSAMRWVGIWQMSTGALMLTMTQWMSGVTLTLAGLMVLASVKIRQRMDDLYY